MYIAVLTSSIGTILKLLFGLGIVKIVALCLGPSGVGKFGQYTTVINILMLLACGGISTGITKYVAEYKCDINKLNCFIAAAKAYSLISCIIMSLIGLIWADYFSQLLFDDISYIYIVYITCATQLFISIFTYITALVNGYKDILISTIINTSYVAIAFIIVVPCVFFYGELGMLLGLSIAPVPGSLIAYLIASNKYKIITNFSLKINYLVFSNLFKYSIMIIVSALSMPLAQILLRNELIVSGGWEQVGYWQASLQLSNSYFLIVTVLLGGYYMPRLSEIGYGPQQFDYATATLKKIMPIVGIGLIFLWIIREHIVNIIFSNNFNQVNNLIGYQFVGDFFKIASYIIGYLVIANTWLRLGVFGDLFQSAIFLLLGYPLANMYGSVGVLYAYSITYILYFVIVSTIFYKFRACV